MAFMLQRRAGASWLLSFAFGLMGGDGGAAIPGACGLVLFGSPVAYAGDTRGSIHCLNGLGMASLARWQSLARPSGNALVQWPQQRKPPAERRFARVPFCLRGSAERPHGRGLAVGRGELALVGSLGAGHRLLILPGVAVAVTQKERA